MADPKPLTKHLGPLGDPENGGLSRSDAIRRGDAVARMVETDGWEVLLELIESQQRHEQKTLMAGRATGDDATYERIIGQWAGMDRVPKLAEGMIRLGEQANREIESGEAASAA